MRTMLDRSKEALKRSADVKKEKEREAEKKRSASLEAKKTASLGSGRSERKSQDKPAGGSTRLPEQTKSREVEAIPPVRSVGKDKERVVAEKTSSSLAKEPTPPEVEVAATEENPPQDKGKAVDHNDELPATPGYEAEESDQPNHWFESSAARANFFQFRYDGPGPFHGDRAACSELIYSLRGATGDRYPPLEEFEGEEGYGRIAQLQVKSLSLMNELMVGYDLALGDARKEAEKERNDADRLRTQVGELQRALTEQKKSNEKLKRRLRYLKEVEVPSVRFMQIRGILKNLEALRDQKVVDVPRYVTDKLAKDLKTEEELVKKVPEVQLNDEELQ